MYFECTSLYDEEALSQRCEAPDSFFSMLPTVAANVSNPGYCDSTYRPPNRNYIPSLETYEDGLLHPPLDHYGNAWYDKSRQLETNFCDSNSYTNPPDTYQQSPAAPCQWQNSLLFRPEPDLALNGILNLPLPSTIYNAILLPTPSPSPYLHDAPLQEPVHPSPSILSSLSPNSHVYPPDPPSVPALPIRASPANSAPIVRTRTRLKPGTGTPNYTSKDANGDYLCSTCGKVISHKRKPDFERHVSSHYPSERRKSSGPVLCCGIPVEQYLAKFGRIPEGSEVMRFYDRDMVGGCGMEFGRSDSLGRHLRKSTCVGDMKGTWHPRKGGPK